MARPGYIFAALISVTALAACANVPPEAKVKHAGQYWQRADTTSALYQRGPKAQQMLNQDITNCVVSIRELEKLGAIRERIPADGTPDPSTPEGHMAQWETPERKGYMYHEHLDYHDFETCMASNGWERIKHVPYKVAEEAQGVYIETITGRKYQSTIGDSTPKQVKVTEEDPNVGHLNE